MLIEPLGAGGIGMVFSAYDPAINNRAVIESDRGMKREALALLEEALAIREDAYGSRHPLVAASLTNVATERLGLGETAAAAAELERVVDLFTELEGADRPLNRAGDGELQRRLPDLTLKPA